MNEVETYLRESGQWNTPIDTDWLGRAKKGPWWPVYYSHWLDAHPDREQSGVNPGGWNSDDRGREWWVSDTPDWDRQWFLERGVRPPKRFGAPERSYWQDCGGGLRRKAYRR